MDSNVDGHPDRRPTEGNAPAVSVESAISAPLYRDIVVVAEQDIPWDELSGQTVLITGAAGLIGRYLTLALLTRNDLYGNDITVIAMVRDRRKAETAFGALLDRADLMLAQQDVCTPFDALPMANFVIHAASPASAQQYENTPVDTLAANTVGTHNVLSYAVRCASTSVLCVSSLKVYGTVTDGSEALGEETLGKLDFTAYQNCYAEGKRVMETLCAAYNKQFDLPVKIARPAYVYGPCGMDDDRVWAQFIANAIRHEDILLRSNGAAYRSFCYVADTAAALLTILLLGEDMLPYNISDKASDVTIRELATIVAESLPERGLALRFEHPADEAEPKERPEVPTPEILDNVRLLSLGWAAQVDLPEGVRRTIEIMEDALGETAFSSPESGKIAES